MLQVVTTVTHEVPEGAINLSQTSGPPGSTVTISGVGFKSFVPVKSVMVGSLEVTPSPRPSTDSQGMMTFDITIPGLDVGIQTIEVQGRRHHRQRGLHRHSLRRVRRQYHRVGRWR